MKTFSREVFIIDDDPSVIRGISLLLRSSGYLVESFPAAEKFLEMEDYDAEGCIILDIFMEGRSGIELQEEIAKKFPNLPIIYLTGFGDIPMSVTALKKGAINFLQKPVDDTLLLQAVEEAIGLSCKMVLQRAEEKRTTKLYDSLTLRQRQIFQLLITGKLNKQIAGELNIAEHTVKLHRGKITEKLGVKSVAEMVHLAEKLKLL